MGQSGSLLDDFAPRAISVPDGLVFRRLPSWATNGMVSELARRRSRASVLHSTDPQRPWVARGVRSIVTVYDLIPLREPGMLESWRLDHRRIYRRYLRQISAADRIVAISRTTAADLQERLAIPRERIDVVYPVVERPLNLERTRPPEPTFLFVGALDPHKQPELAVKALARFRARHRCGRLRLIGPAAPVHARRLRLLVEELGVRDAVTVEGHVSDRALEDAYRTATALVSSSRVEGFGLPPVEAILRGVPVIAVETAAARETLGGAAVLVPPDAEAIAEAMADPKPPTEGAREELGRRYSIASATSSLAHSYRRLLD